MKMIKYLFILGAVCSVNTQVLNRVSVINPKQYMLDVINEVMKRVEEQGWWNLPVPGHENNYDETLITWKLIGNVKYTNAFVASIQKIGMLESVNQTWTATNGVKVEIRGQLRIEDLAIGADIVSNLTDGVHHRTGLIIYPLATFDFSICRDAVTLSTNVTVVGNLERTTINKITIMPMDKLADALVKLFDSTSFDVSFWGPAVFQPLAEHIVKTEIVKFPGLCYDCPITPDKSSEPVT